MSAGSSDLPFKPSMNDKDAEKKNRWVKIIVCNIAILAVGIAILELLFGNWLSPNRLNRLNLLKDVEIHYDISSLYTTTHTSTLYEKDRHGFRGQYATLSEIDILTVGGSTTDQRHISEGEIWQDILQQNFEENGQTISIVNAGVDGQSTYGHIKNFDWWFPSVPDLRAKYCLVYLGLNDFYKEADDKYDDLVRHGQGSFLGTIKERSAIYYLYRTLKGMHSAEIVDQLGHRKIHFNSLSWTNNSATSSYETLMQERLKAYEQRLTILVDKIRAFGAIPILVTQRSMKYKNVNGQLVGIADIETYDGVSINGVDFYYMMNLLNKRTATVSHEKDCIFIDLAAELDVSEKDFYDFNHMNPSGCKRMGDYLYSKIKVLFQEPQ